MDIQDIQNEEASVRIFGWLLPQRIRQKLSEEGPMRYFLHTGWNLAGKVISLAISFFVSIYVVRSLGPSNWGLLSYIVSFTGIFAFIASLGIDNILYVDLIKEPERRDELMGTAFLLKLCGGTVAFIIVLIFSYFFKNPPYVNVLMAVVASAFFLQPFNVVNSYFQANVQSKPTVVLSVIVNGLLSLLKIAFVLTHRTIGYFALIYCIEAILNALGFLYIYAKAGLHASAWKGSWSLAKVMLNASWPLVLSTAFAFIYSRIDQVMIKQLINQTSVGLYDTAVRLAETWYIFPSIIIGSMYPAIINAQKNNIPLFENRITKLYAVTLYMSVLFIIPMSFFSGTIIRLLYGQAFLGAAGVLKIYVWAGISVTLATVINQYLISIKSARISLFLNLLGMITNIVLNIFFIPRFGIYGAAWATLISYSVIPLGIIFFKNARSQFKYIAHALLVRF